MMTKKHGKNTSRRKSIGRRRKAGTRDSTTSSRALCAGQANSTSNNQLAASAAALVVTSPETVARMPPPGQKLADAFNNQIIHSENVHSFKPNQNAFNHSKKGQPLSAASARKAKSRAVRDIVAAVKNAGSLHHQAVALKGALIHPEIRRVGKSIGFVGEESDKDSLPHSDDEHSQCSESSAGEL
jgi:hypothetical protein